MSLPKFARQARFDFKKSCLDFQRDQLTIPTEVGLW